MAGESWHAAEHHRADVPKVRFVAVTGSCGKTTTVTLAHQIVSGSLVGTASREDANCAEPLAQAILNVSAGDDYCIQEVGAWGPGTIDPALALVRPDVGVVTNVRRDHFSAFRGLSQTRQEKAKAIAVLPRDGTAILNADDERVASMAALTRARVLTFGRARSDLRASEITANWPQPLRFRLTHDGVSRLVGTRLIGEHGLGSALAALAIGLALDIALDDLIARLEQADPPSRRMTVHEGADGVTFIRDDFKAPSDSLADIVSFMAKASATRKIAVVGQISDYPGRSRRTYTEFVNAARSVVDEIVLVGERAEQLWGEGPLKLSTRPGSNGRVTVFATVKAATDALRDQLRTGDLVLLKASGVADHLERILLARAIPVTCWDAHCGRVHACDSCGLLTNQVSLASGPSMKSSDWRSATTTRLATR